MSPFCFFGSSYCNETHKNVGGFIQGTVRDYLPNLFTDIVLCAGNSASRQGSCKGDSGSPLMIFNTSEARYVQVGIVAGGIQPDSCGDKNYPGIFTRIDHPEIYDFVDSQFPKRGNHFDVGSSSDLRFKCEQKAFRHKFYLEWFTSFY